MSAVTVTRLIRVAYGDYELKTMRPGTVMEVQCKPVEKQQNKGPLQKFRKRNQSKNESGYKNDDYGSDTASPVQWVTFKRNF